jgi:mRNA interferase HigB
MRIIDKKALASFYRIHADGRKPLLSWYDIVKRASFQNLQEVRQAFGSAEAVGKVTVFDIKGNDYRLITAMHYNTQVVFIREVMTHADYSKNEWQKRHSVFD